MHISADDARLFKLQKNLGFVLLVGLPVIYFVVSLFKQGLVGESRSEGVEVMFYILLLVASFSPFSLPVMEKYQIRMIRRVGIQSVNPGRVYFTLSLVKMVIVSSVYLYGLITVLLGAEIVRMLWFYPLGIIWSLIIWPGEKQFEKFLKQVEAK